MSLALTILPIALAIAVGWAARAAGVIRAEHWPGIEALSFRVLGPALMVHAIAGADLSLSRIGPFGAALLATIALTGGAVLLLGRRTGGAALSTLFQSTIRYNGYVSLAVADLMIGAAGMSLIAVSMAVMVPVVNVACIVVLVLLCSGETGPRRIARAVAANPLVLGAAAGIAVNLAGGLPDWAMDTLQLVGRAALGVALLAVGAGLQLRRLLLVRPLVVAGLALRPFAVTGVFVGLAAAFGLSALETLAGILIFAVPSASNGFIVARAMGGDADLYADLLAWQVLLCLVAIPAYVALAT